jgi:hypothetical protein
MSSKSNKDQCLDLSNILQLLNIIDSEVKSRLNSVRGRLSSVLIIHEVFAWIYVFVNIWFFTIRACSSVWPCHQTAICLFDVGSLTSRAKSYKDKRIITTIRKRTLKKLLLDSCKKTPFSINDQLYRQIDGISMGSPLGPTLADILMTTFEDEIVRPWQKWLEPRSDFSHLGFSGVHLCWILRYAFLGNIY